MPTKGKSYFHLVYFSCFCYMIKKKTTIVDQFCVISQHIINKGSDQVLFIINLRLGSQNSLVKKLMMLLLNTEQELIMGHQSRDDKLITPDPKCYPDHVTS